MPRAPIAPRLSALLELLVGGGDTPIGLGLRAWDGSTSGPPGSPVVTLRSPRALRHLLWAPGELGLARAYVSGDLDTDDIAGALKAYLGATAGGDPSAGRWGRSREITRTAAGVGALGPRPPVPAEEARRPRGRLHSQTRDRRAVRHHYDVGNEFYEIVLGTSMVYSCAYWAGIGAGYGLDDAQRDKLELVCRKLAVQPGQRLLDVGCGWGSLAIHAAREHGARVVGVTISPEQADLGRRRVLEAGLADRVEIRLQDYRDVVDGPFDAISSIGMAEHVGRSAFVGYAAHLHGLLRPGGRLLNHQIAARPGPWVTSASFTARYVFPDGELLPVGHTVQALEEAGFEVRDVESLREHYARTLRAWLANLDARWDDAIRLTSPARARVWRLYMVGSALGFEVNRLGVNQVLAVRTDDRGGSGMPPTRPPSPRSCTSP